MGLQYPVKCSKRKSEGYGVENCLDGGQSWPSDQEVDRPQYVSRASVGEDILLLSSPFQETHPPRKKDVKSILHPPALGINASSARKSYFSKVPRSLPEHLLGEAAKEAHPRKNTQSPTALSAGRPGS
jgi:hypothetical protein